MSASVDAQRSLVDELANSRSRALDALKQAHLSVEDAERELDDVSEEWARERLKLTKMLRESSDWGDP